ncbi:MAG: HAD family phosphatase [Paracoccaceae bacterium]
MKNVIFDFGNVIIRWDPYRALSTVFNSREEMDKTLIEIGFFDWNLEQDRGRSWPEGIAIAKRDMPKHAHIFQAYADGLRPAHDELVAGTSELIENLHNKGVGLFGLTNASLATVDVVKSVAPVLGLMQDIVVSAAESMIKPDAEIFELCLSRNNLERSQALFVDDSLANCEAARTLGIAAHHFSDAAGLMAELLQRGLL